MQDLEDEPEDVQNATPVQDEIMRAQMETFTKKTGKRGTCCKTPKPQPCCRKPKPPVERVECCPEKKEPCQDLPPRVQFCIAEPYTRTKQDLVPRHCMTREKHLDYLATPKFVRKSDGDFDDTKSIIRKIRTLYPRTEWLSKPTKRRMLMTLIYKGTVLPVKLVDHLIEVLEDETAITPEQAEDLVQNKKTKKKDKKKKGKKSVCEEEEPPCELAGGDPLDIGVAQCQLSMAQRFVRSILNWKCSYPREDYSDISEVILEKLSEQLEYSPIGKEDRKSEQMRILADVFGCWISDVLVKVAEKYAALLENDAVQRQKECQEAIKEPDKDDDSCEEEDGYPKYLEAHCAKEQLEKCTQFDDEDGEEEGEDDGESTTSSDDCVDVEQQTEPKPKADCGTTTHSKMDKCVKIDECCTANVKCPDEEELDNICSRLSQAFQTDVPFVTFAKIIDTLYCMIGNESENDMCCPMDNRIHRALYEKFEDVMCRENPKLFDERMKDILNVVTGKLARWFRRALNKRQIKFFGENPAEVESTEIRDWAQWLDETAKFADGWTNWIHKVTTEAQCIREAGGVTRGQWQDWTGNFESNALLFRRKYLETVHQEHHNIMMLCDRDVLKTCTKKIPQYSETTIKNTIFESCSRDNN